MLRKSPIENQNSKISYLIHSSISKSVPSDFIYSCNKRTEMVIKKLSKTLYRNKIGQQPNIPRVHFPPPSYHFPFKATIWGRRLCETSVEDAN